MPFSISSHDARASDRSEKVYVLANTAETVRAEVWPSFGFNCLRWQVRNNSGDWGDVLFCDPTWETNPVPTRSGNPILFPFPNRLKDGAFTHEGRAYQLPKNEKSGFHAIHGFTPRNPWRLVGSGTFADHAWVRGEFRLGVDAPASLIRWPGDFLLHVTYRLHVDRLIVEVAVKNQDMDSSFPMGLGLHPYFACPNAPDASVDEMTLRTTAKQIWETEGGIPTGRILPVPPELDFSSPRQVGSAEIDSLFTDLGTPAQSGGKQVVAELGHVSAPGKVRVLVPAEFRELVLFTPPHRKAIAIEPYTCATDAANLQARGVDSGWRTLALGETFETSVEYEWVAE